MQFVYFTHLSLVSNAAYDPKRVIFATVKSVGSTHLWKFLCLRN